MSNVKALGCVMAAMLATTVASAQGEDGVSFGGTADFFSKYVWRGQNVVDDWVLQPSAFASYKGFTASVWGNVDVTGEGVDDWEFNEIDWALDYSNTVPGLDWLGYSLGVIYYDFPNTPFEATTEVYAGLSVDVPLSPAVRWFYDVDEIEGSYIQLSIGHTVEKFVQWTENAYCDVQVGASIGYGTDGYNDGYFGVDDSGMNDLTLSAGLPICLGSWTIKPVIAYSTMIGDDIRAATAESDNFWGGISASYSF
jgi:hypothetical protein